MSEPSGAQWCDRFPTSRSLDDLAEPFRSNAKAFVAALEAAGIAVTIAATLRPAERAWLMHWAWMIAREAYDPASVPARPGLDIAWLHRNANGTPDLRASIQAAAAMVDGYGMAHNAALDSRHIEGRALDMSMSWSGTAEVKDAKGDLHAVGIPRSGMNLSLWLIGKSYGVMKLATDPPHWSDDGN